ncbi:MAG: insulinase family protein [Acidobacteriia bacterium]|nr:insulinase family protein [Terriglobia bacterium]
MALIAFAAMRFMAQESRDHSRNGTLFGGFQFKAPVSQDLVKVQLPPPVEVALENGLTLIIIENHRSPVIHIEFHVADAGPVCEPTGNRGLAELTTEMLLAGTDRRGRRQLAEDMEHLGVSVSTSAPAGSSEAVIRAWGLSDNFDQWLSVLADVVLRPRFSAEELIDAVRRRESQQQRQAASPGYLADQQFRKAVYGDKPGVSVSATLKVCPKCMVDALVQWHFGRFLPQKTVLGISGDIRPRRAIAAVRKIFGAWAGSEFKAPIPSEAAQLPHARAFVIDRPESVQSTIRIGNLGASRLSEDYFPMLVLNRIFGSEPSSRLPAKLRGVKGMAYSVGSSFSANQRPGAWTAYADVRAESASEAIKLMLFEIDDLCRQEIPQEEVNDAKRALVAAYAFFLEQPASALGLAIQHRQLGLPSSEANKFHEHIMSVTRDDVHRAACRYFDRATMQLVVVGDSAKVRPAVEEFVPWQQIQGLR